MSIPNNLCPLSLHLLSLPLCQATHATHELQVILTLSALKTYLIHLDALLQFGVFITSK